MRQPAQDAGSQLLNDLVDQITEKLQAGKSPDLDAYIGEYPELEEQLRRLMPSIQMLADLGHLPTETHPSEGRDTRLVQGLLGDYQILREVGRGGMGVVYEAQQVSLGRRVALKVLPFAATLDQRQLKRFQNEARAAASLRHPNIVQVHFVGCERAVHFYAMDFIEGQTLAELIHHQRRLEELEGDSSEVDYETPTAAVARQTSDGASEVRQGSPSSCETKRAAQAAISTERSTKTTAYIRMIAELGVQVAEALDEAHQHGVIHRDMKPSNVILDNQAKPWVTDFGLARIESDATLTVSGDLLGTIRYMSPEQALAKRIVVDHRTDVYSLGVTLYELLTLQPAFSGQDREELLRQIAFEEPKAPRRRNRAISEELEIIVLKAIAKNPAERYGTAQELADDLNRFLEDRPILARRPTLWQRAAKWSRRHKPVVAAGVVLLVMATIGSALSTYLVAKEKARTEEALVQSQRAEKRAREAEARERNLARTAQRLERESRKNLKRARDNLNRALDAADQLVTWLEDDRFFVQPELQELRQRVLKDALGLFEAFIDRNGTDPIVRYQTARSYWRIFIIQMKLGRQAPAEEACQQAISLAKQLVAEFPSQQDYRAILAQSWKDLGAFQLFNKHRPRDAERPLRCACDLYSELITECSKVGVDQATLVDYRHHLIFCNRALAVALAVQRKYQEADKRFRQSIVESKELAIECPADPWHRALLALTLRDWCAALIPRGQRKESVDALRQALEINEQLTRDFPDHWHFLMHLATDHRFLGVVLRTQGERQKAEQLCRKAIAILEELSRNRPTVSQVHREVVYCYWNLAEILESAQRLKEAAQALRRAVDAGSECTSLAPSDPNQHQLVADTYIRLGNVLKESQEQETSEDAYRQAIEEYHQAIRLAPENHLLFMDRGNAHKQLKQWDKAVEDYRQAVRIKPTASWCWLALFDTESARGGLSQQTLVVQEAKTALGKPTELEVLFQCAAWNLWVNRHGDYEKICGEAAAKYADSTDARTLYLTARLAALTNQRVLETGQLVDMASRSVEAKPTPWHQHTLGLCLLRAGQEDAAIEQFNQSLTRIWTTQPVDFNDCRWTEGFWEAAPVSWLGLAIAHAAAGQDSRAREWLRKTQEWCEKNPLDLTSKLHPHDRLACQLLLREAEQLIEGNSPTEDNATEKTP